MRIGKMLMGKLQFSGLGETRPLYDQGMDLSFPLIDLAVRRFVILPHFLINYEYMSYEAGLSPASLSKAILLPSN